MILPTYNKSLELSAEAVILEVVTLLRQEQVLGFSIGAATQLYVMPLWSSSSQSAQCCLSMGGSMQFEALDVETANASFASVCQIGIASFDGDRLVREWKTFVDPQDYFDDINISIHGIMPETVKGAPTIACLSAQINDLLSGRICVCHTHFDRTAIKQAFEKYNASLPDCAWLDSACVARRTWSEFSHSGYGLENICRHIGYSFSPHDALEDAKAAAHVLLAACRETGLTAEQWLSRVSWPICSRSASTAQREPSIHREANPDGHLYGEIMVFTGRLCIPRAEAADKASRAGCHIDPNVTRDTTVLVVGDQDIRQLAGHEKSSKQRKAEELIRHGQNLRIIQESDFVQLVAP